MIKLRTEIERIPLPRLIDRGEGIMLLGSCFTDHIGQWLEASWLPVLCNPWGVLFNPASIASSLLRILSDSPYEPELHAQNGRYYSFDHHGKWSGDHPEALRQQLISLDLEIHSFLSTAKHLVVTFGTSWIYEREGKVVANCHKFPASDFSRRCLSVAEIVDQWSQVIEAFNSHSSQQIPHSIIFTVSPIRHVRDGLHANQLSKATLLLAIDELVRLYPAQVEYLPVYELFMDDLRDYRFYAEDMVHPSPLAIEAVKELFVDCALTSELRKYMKESEAIVRALQHRPSDPDSPQYQAFLAETLRKKETLLSKFTIKDCKSS